MQKVIENNRCCGCYACINACPKNAITMKDEAGFKYPAIDQEKCINCGLCKRVCPVLNSSIENRRDVKAYACYNKNLEDRLNSSSGGLFILIAKEIIKRNGVVFGAAFNEDFSVSHTCVETIKDLKKFMGSKYVQSSIDETYKKAKEFLESDRFVLFSGTPCQIEGLKKYLQKDYDKLYTQDFICHGVPSPKLWEKYLDYQHELAGSNITAVSFRNKDDGWSKFRLTIMFKNKKHSEYASKDIYMQLFLSNLCLRESCYNCAFKKVNRESDLTLADFWGINEINPKFNDDKGVSLIAIHSKKGAELFNAIKKDIEFIEVDLEKAIKHNPSMINSAPITGNHKKFMNDLDKLSIEELSKKYLKKKSVFARAFRKLKNKIILR